MSIEMHGYLPPEATKDEENITPSELPEQMEGGASDTKVGEGDFLSEPDQENTGVAGLPEQMTGGHDEDSTQAKNVFELPTQMVREEQRGDERFVDILSEDLGNYTGGIPYNYSTIDFVRGNPHMRENTFFYRNLDTGSKESLKKSLDDIPENLKSDVRISFELGDDVTTKLESDGTIVINMKEKGWDTKLGSIVDTFHEGLWEKEVA